MVKNKFGNKTSLQIIIFNKMLHLVRHFLYAVDVIKGQGPKRGPGVSINSQPLQHSL